MRFSPGSTVGPYEISGAIGAGGMGEVYRARDTRLGREVAVKVLPADFARDGQRLARFEREARAASALNHPNIVTIHDFARADSDCYLVMELVRGESLRDVVSRGALPLRKLFDVATGIAEGLAAAHAAGLIHRDLKPENVMLTAEGLPKILDFGLVKPTAETGDGSTQVRVTQTGSIVGTASYMSPEQIRGAEIDTTSDQFALGLILHEMATGKHPFRRETQNETLTAILRDEPPRLGDSVPEPFAWIVERCLSKEPSQRYASTADLARDLASLRTRTGSGAATKPDVRPERSSARKWILAIVAVLALVAVVAALAVRNGTAVKPVSDPMHLHLSTGQLQPHFGETAVPVSISPTGRYLVTQGSGQQGRSELWLTDLSTGEMRMVAESGFGATWSNDSRAIAYFSDGKLKTQPIDGGPPTIVCDAPTETTAAWHGDTILFVRYSGTPDDLGIYRVNATGGVPERVVGVNTSRGTSGVPSLPWWPQFLPDGRHFLYVAFMNSGGAIEHDVMLGSLDGAVARTIGRIDSRVVYSSGHLLFVRDGTLLAQPFDVNRARLTGEARPLVDDLHYFRSTGMAAFTVSANGILAWRTARRPSRLVWVDRNGTEVDTVDTAHFDHDGRLSRDGSQYVVGVKDAKQGTGDIWKYDLRRGNSERLTFELFDQKAPLWAADRETVYYRTDGYGGPPDIYALRAGKKPQVVYAGRSVEHPEDASPDGKWLLFTTVAAASSDIHVLPLNPPGQPRPLVATPFHEASPRFSPDGKWIAYASNVSGRSEIYVVRFGEGGSGQRISSSGGRLPRWSPTGTELFFLGPEGQLFAVPAAETFGTPRMLFQAAAAATFEPGPSGDRFLMHLEEKQGEPDVQILVNWPALLTRERR